jgi:phosphoglycerol geranylgeranyltransferase
MLMNSKSRKFLIGEQLQGAPYLEKYGVEALPTGYLVFSPGGKVGEVGEAELIKSNQKELVRSYALTAKMFGFKILYLEAGSGSSSQVDPTCIQSAREVDELCLMVGGGIRTGEDASKAAAAGANWVVTGTLTEDAADMDELRQRIKEVVTGIQSSSS